MRTLCHWGKLLIFDDFGSEKDRDSCRRKLRSRKGAQALPYIVRLLLFLGVVARVNFSSLA